MRFAKATPCAICCSFIQRRMKECEAKQKPGEVPFISNLPAGIITAAAFSMPTFGILDRAMYEVMLD